MIYNFLTAFSRQESKLIQKLLNFQFSEYFPGFILTGFPVVVATDDFSLLLRTVSPLVSVISHFWLSFCLSGHPIYISFVSFSSFACVFFKFSFIDFRENNKNINLCSTYLCIHRLILYVPCRGLNSQPWHIRTTLQPTELPADQGCVHVLHSSACTFSLSVIYCLPMALTAVDRLKIPKSLLLVLTWPRSQAQHLTSRWTTLSTEYIQGGTCYPSSF